MRPKAWPRIPGRLARQLIVHFGRLRLEYRSTAGLGLLRLFTTRIYAALVINQAPRTVDSTNRRPLSSQSSKPSESRPSLWFASCDFDHNDNRLRVAGSVRINGGACHGLAYGLQTAQRLIRSMLNVACAYVDISRRRSLLLREATAGA